MSKKIELKGITVLNNNNKASIPPGQTFVAGKSIRVAVPASEAEKLLSIQNITEEKVPTLYDLPKRAIKFEPILNYDEKKKVDTLNLKFTRVPSKDKEFEKNEDGTWKEVLCNYIPVGGKMQPVFPEVTLNGQVPKFPLPFSESVVDIVLYVTPRFIQDDKTVKYDFGVESITIVKAPEGKEYSAKSKNIVEIPLDEASEEVEEKSKAKKSSTKSETPSNVVEVVDDELEGVFGDM